MINQEKVTRAIELQKRANQEIDTYGQTSESTFDEMMDVFDSLTIQEEEAVIDQYGSLENIMSHEVETRDELNWYKNMMLK
jgi:SUMO ligase MMS21 Smc5/6 complex component